MDWYHYSELPVKDHISKVLLKSAIAHLYFESIHPFEDGNGRIGRALAEFILSQGLKSSALLSMSKTIEQDKIKYYDQLKFAQRSLDITDWVNYFAEMILDAQKDAKELIQFTLKTNTFDLEWPPRSGKIKKFPEVDRAGWFNFSEAKRLINERQIAFLEQFSELS